MIRDTELPVFTFGWELEATGRSHRTIPDVMVGHDGSVSGDGLEYRTRRESVFDPERSLAALRALTMSPGLQVDRSCGFHVHVGLGIRTRKLHSWAANFVTLARIIEPDVFAAVPESRRENHYCRSWKDFRGSVIAPQYSANKHNNGTRYCWINPVEIFRPGGIRTIEIRLMGHSKNYLYLLAWTSFCRRMAASSWALVHDPSRLEQEILDLKEAIKLVRQCFVTREITGVAKARNIVMLAARAGFYETLTPSLKKLTGVEKNIRYQMDQDAAAKDNYADQIEQMRHFVAIENASLASTHRDIPIPEGAIVEALEPDGQGYTIIGHHYRVISDNLDNQRITLFHPMRGSWYVSRSTVKLAEVQSVTVLA